MNQHESNVAEGLRKKGYNTIITSGWPDLLCRNNSTGDVVAVECKQRTDRVRPNQRLCHQMLATAGLPVYVVGPKYNNVKNVIDKQKNFVSIRNELHQTQLERGQETINALRKEAQVVADALRMFATTLSLVMASEDVPGCPGKGRPLTWAEINKVIEKYDPTRCLSMDYNRWWEEKENVDDVHRWAPRNIMEHEKHRAILDRNIV